MEPLRALVASTGRWGKKILRRRYLALCIILVMAPLVFTAGKVPGVYYSRADVLFLVPAGTAGGNLLQADPAQTLSFAAIIEHRVNAEEPSAAPRSTSAPLYGTGSRHSSVVYIPSSGGQWQMSFSRPVITVEVTGETSGEVASRLDHLVGRVTMLASSLQQQYGVEPAARITTDLSPSTPSVAYIPVRNSRADVALILITLGLAYALPTFIDRLIRKKDRRAGALSR